MSDLASFLRHMANPNNFNDATCERLRLAADACDALESSQARIAAYECLQQSTQARVRELERGETFWRHRAGRAEARVVLLRDELKEIADWTPGYYDNRDNQCAQTLSDNARSALVTLDPAADRLLSERKLLRSIAAIANSISDCVTEFGKETDGACACHEYFEHMDTALTALHEFDDKETK